MKTAMAVAFWFCACLGWGPVVFEAQRFRVEEAQLGQAIQRLGELMRQAEKEEKR